MKYKDVAEILLKYPEFGEIECAEISAFINGQCCIGHMPAPADKSYLLSTKYWSKLGIKYIYLDKNNFCRFISYEISEDKRQVWFELVENEI